MDEHAPGNSSGETEWSDLQVVVELEGLTEAAADDLRRLFDRGDEDVAFSHAFGGADTIAIITKFGKAAVDKLISYFGSLQTVPSKTKIRIGKGTIEMNGFSREDIEALIASPRFMQLAKAAVTTKP